MSTDVSTVRPRLSEIFWLFLRLGSTAFGGPAAHIALMEEEIVRRRQWVNHAEFVDLIGATNLIPGPNSTELAIHIGYRLRGWPGLLVAGTSFIVPAFLIVWTIAWFYVRYGSLPEFQAVFLGVRPVILAVIVQAIWKLGRTAIKDRWLTLLSVLAFVLYLVWGHEIAILFLIAGMNVILHLRPPPPAAAALLMLPALRAWGAGESPLSIFAYFAKVGSVLFGSGYVLIAFLQSDLVAEKQWLNQKQLIDAIAVGQFTPGPVFTTATFVGYLEGGHLGAVAATLGIFAPAFFFVAISAPLIPRLRQWRWTAPVLDGLNVASLSFMAGAATVLAREAISLYAGVVFLLSLGLLLRFKISSVWLILAAGTLNVISLVFL